MKALGWFLALFTFWLALLLTSSEILTTRGASGEEENEGALLGLEKGKRYVFRAGELTSGNVTGSTADGNRGAETEYHVLVDDMVPGREATLTVSFQPGEPAAPAARTGETYRIIVGMDGHVKDVRTLDVADAAGGDALKLRQLRENFESILAPSHPGRGGTPAGDSIRG